jgi:hypothetical protein
LAACDPAGTLHLQHELGLIKEAAAKGIAASSGVATDTTWALWTEFCRDLMCDPTLQDIEEPLPLLQIFANRYRVGHLAPSQSPVKARRVEAALCSVGQMITTLGYRDPWLQPSGKLDIRLHRQLQAYSKEDPPPSRVKPIPLQILHWVVQYCFRTQDARLNTIGQMVVLGFFFLLHPGEYAKTDNPDAAPFRLRDIHLLVHNVRLNTVLCSEQDLLSVTHVALEFTTQKNGVRGELVGLG